MGGFWGSLTQFSFFREAGMVLPSSCIRPITGDLESLGFPPSATPAGESGPEQTAGHLSLLILQAWASPADSGASVSTFAEGNTTIIIPEGCREDVNEKVLTKH